MNDLPDLGLTIHWPWATAISHGPKRVENRTWRPWPKIHGEWIAIHCGKTRDEGAIHQMEMVDAIDWHPDDGPAFDDVAGKIVGAARVVGYIDDDRGTSDLFTIPSHLQGELPGRHTARSEALTKLHRGAWFSGPVGWILDDVEPLDEPIPARGQTGLWSVDEQIGAARPCQTCGDRGCVEGEVRCRECGWLAIPQCPDCGETYDDGTPKPDYCVCDRAVCDRCGRPDGRTVAELGSGAWRPTDGSQWRDSQGREVDLIPSTGSIRETEVSLETCRVRCEERQLCAHCRLFYGVGTDVDDQGQGLLLGGM